ncbi:MAG: CHC2 zinc finger domain-containing protein [Planctomycetia bacterium]|mgnify:CR=1 FL=1|nr:CHC2 zinc finger domain-containing protein [Planctomycetia bacterium]
MAQWIDFRALRAQLKIADVLAHHGVVMKVKGDQSSGFCPLPGHEDRKSPSFSAHYRKNCFHCFGCGAKGNAVDLEILLMGLDPADPKSARAAGLKLAERFGLNVTGEKRTGEEVKRDGKRYAKRPGNESVTAGQPPKSIAVTVDPIIEPDDEAVSMAAQVNPPLGFTLQNLDPSHAYLLGRGLNAETIEHFGLGFCGKGMLKDRIAIPLHNEAGDLIGYAGRAVDDASITADNPRYLLPGRRERDGKLIEFRKSRVLYNAHRIEDLVDSLVVVEGFASVWWLWQHGIQNVVALIGSSASEWQIAAICKLVTERARLFVLPDGDAAGVQLAHTLIPHLAARRWCTWVKLLADEQPTDLDGEMLAALLSS